MTESPSLDKAPAASLPADAAPENVELVPFISRLRARRMLEILALRLAPAATAGAMSYGHADSGWEAILIFLCVLGVSALLRSPHYPVHLIPFASTSLYVLGPVLGAMLAVLISTGDGYTRDELALGDVVTPALGALMVLGLGGIVTRRFVAQRQVQVAVIGSPDFARGLQTELDVVGIRGYQVLGCISPEESASPGRSADGVRTLGSLEDLREIVLSSGVELLVLGPLRPGSGRGRRAGDEERYQAGNLSRLAVFEHVAEACLDLPVSMLEAGSLYEDLFGHVPLGTTTSAWFQYLLHPSHRGGQPVSKRMMDLGLGALAALLAAPLLAISALLIKLTSPGPAFHRQTRIGGAGKEIEMVKLRTMRVDADADGARWSGSDDERITGVGAILRRLHIDELPQIWLVLKGEMSLVGPRPEQPSIVTDLESRFSYYDRRHLAKPGITGWAQVRCGYGGSHIGTAWKLCHDLFYLKRRSLLFDVLIVLETLSTVVFPEPINRPDERFIVAIRAGGELPPASA